MPSPTSPKPQKPGVRVRVSVILPVHLTAGSLVLLTKSEINSSTEDKGQDRRGRGTAVVTSEPEIVCVLFSFSFSPAASSA